MNKSNQTKFYKRYYVVICLLETWLLYSPFIYFLAKSIIENSIQAEQALILGFTGTLAIAFALINIMNKSLPMSKFYIILLGLSIVLNILRAFLITICIACLLDEIVIRPLKKSIRNKYIINKELDKRL